MSFARDLAAGLQPLVDAIYPPRCPLCGTAVAVQGGLCGECWGTLEFPGADAGDILAHLCAPDAGTEACAPQPVRLTAATLYNATSRQLVLNLKHGRKIALAGLMGRLMAARLADPAPGEPPPLLVPVPLHRWRLWGRGFNQAALLARAIAQAGKGAVLVDALERRRRTRSLGGLGREAREAVLRGAIMAAPTRRAAIRGRRIILVDDVLTSGATTRACVAALRQAGAASVEVVAFAQVEGGRA